MHCSASTSGENFCRPQTCVHLRGLSKDELNGSRAQIREVDVQAGRYLVHLQNGKHLCPKASRHARSYDERTTSKGRGVPMRGTTLTPFWVPCEEASCWHAYMLHSLITCFEYVSQPPAVLLVGPWVSCYLPRLSWPAQGVLELANLSLWVVFTRSPSRFWGPPFRETMNDHATQLHSASFSFVVRSSFMVASLYIS